MGTEVAHYDQQWAEAAQQSAGRVHISSSFLSTAGGQFRLGEDPVPGNALVVVVAHFIYENTYYTHEWNPDNAMPPTCFAMGHEMTDLAPHPAMQSDLNFFEPQHHECASCPQNQWGSATKGRGKACDNRYRLALIPAGYMEAVPGVRNGFQPTIHEDEEHYASADMLVLKVPKTSTKAFDRFVKQCQSEHARPPYGVVTEISILPRDGGGYSLNFEAIGLVDGDMFPTMRKRHQEAADNIIEPYQPPEERQTTQQRAGNRLSGLRSSR